MTMIDVFGARVRQARILRRMTGTSVVAEMKWKGPRLTRLEQAELTSLPVAEAERLAEVLRFPCGFFTARPVSQVTPADLLFRAPKSTPKGEREYLAQFAVAAGDFLETLQDRWQLPPPKLPVLPRDIDVAVAAAEVRSALGLDKSVPIPHLIHQVERCGVPVVVRPPRSRSTGELDWTAAEEPRDKHIAYSTRVGEFGERPLIVLRALKSWERTRWSVAHEVGHLVLHADGVESDDHEEQANRFASELLAPVAALTEDVPPVPSLVNLLPLKSKWGISMGALLRHLHDAQLIDSPAQ
jgi:Zn-dependent peptidase ImmA (M78 family)